MKKVILKTCSFVLLLTLALSACILCGCKTQYYDEKGIADAYEAGWITQEQLKSIAYYHNKNTVGDSWEPEVMDFQLIPQTELDEKVSEHIRKSYLKLMRQYDSKLKMKDVKIDEYYGTYDGYVVANMWVKLNFCDIIFRPELEIGGVMFYNYNYLSVFNTNC